MSAPLLFARELLQLRKAGALPAYPVFVSRERLNLHRRFENVCIVVASPPERTDMSMLAGCKVEVAVHVAKDRDAMELARAVMAARARDVVLWETSTGHRWWLVQDGYPWPKPQLLHEHDRRLVEHDGRKAEAA